MKVIYICLIEDKRLRFLSVFKSSVTTFSLRYGRGWNGAIFVKQTGSFGYAAESWFLWPVLAPIDAIA